MRITIILTIVLLFATTTKGFTQWAEVYSGTTENLADGCFINDSTGFIISENGLVLKTTDYGNTWVISSLLSGHFTKIYSVSADTIFAGGNCLYRTDDGGVSWNLIANFSGTIVDLDFFDSKTGYLILPGYDTCYWGGDVYIEDQYILYQTTNYGISWLPELLTGSKENRMQVINDTIGYCMRDYRDIIAHCGGPWENNSVITLNKGIDWNAALQPSYEGSQFSFINKDTAYFHGHWNHIYKTTDRCNSFSYIYSDFNDEINQLSFLNDIDGYILSDFKIYCTASSGVLWTTEYTSAHELSSIFDNDKNQIVTLGKNGLILKKSFIPNLVSETVYRLTPDMTTLFFGPVFVDSTMIKELSFTNTGNDSLDIIINSSEDYKISFFDSLFTETLNLTLAPNEESSIFVIFNPDTAKFFYDSLFFVLENLDTLYISLKGVGYNGLTGIISEDTIICTDTLYIGVNVIINEDVTVTLCSGTHVIFLGNYKILVKGALHALGDSLNPIDFSIADPIILWNGIEIDNSDFNDSSIFIYSNITTKAYSDLITIKNGNVYFDNCNIGNSTYSNIRQLNRYGDCKIHISNSNLFNAGEYGLRLYNSSTSATIINSCFYNNNNSIYFSLYTDYDKKSKDDFSKEKSICMLKISKNKVFDNIEPINIYSSFKSSVIYFSENEIYNNNEGIYIESNNIKFENNSIYSNSKCRNVLKAIDSLFMVQNLIFNNYSPYYFFYSAGINIEAGNFTLLTNNLICNNKNLSEEIAGNLNLFSSSDNPDVRIYNNIIYNVSDPGNKSINWDSSLVPDLKYNCINEDSINNLYENNYNFDPQFVKPVEAFGYIENPGDYDWSLTESSRCINMGYSSDNSFLLPYDFAGNPRVFNQIVDIGPFEFQGNYVSLFESNAYPNPFNDIINIETDLDEECEIFIYDMLSRFIFQQKFNRLTKIETSDFNKGSYIYIIKSSGSVIKSGKLIKI